MMLGAFVVATLAGQTVGPKITFKDGAFIVSGALGTEIVPVTTKAPSPDPVDRAKGRFSFTLRGVTVTFDKRGLTVQTKSGSSTTKLRAVPTSGKVATKDSNAELMALLEDHKRTLDVAALSGWHLGGHVLYLLPRWDDTNKKPWLEALIKVNLDDKRPAPILIGKFEALSSATGIVDDVLLAREGKLAVLGNKGEAFGLAVMSANGKDSSFVPYGQAVSKARLFPDGESGWTLSPTPYGTNIIGLFDTKEKSMANTGEIRGKMVSILSPGLARYRTPSGVRIHNLLSGAEMTVESDSSVANTSNGVLLWAPAVSPTKAALYDPSFRRLTVWTAPPVTTKPEPPKVVAQPAKSKPDGTGKSAKTKDKKSVKKEPSNPNVASAKKPGGSLKKPAKVASKTTAKPSKSSQSKPTKKKPQVQLEVTSRPSKKKKG